MASGWISLLPDSDLDSEYSSGPFTLPDGRLACSPHLMIVCGKCCVDYSFVEPDYDYNDEDDDDDDNDKIDCDLDYPQDEDGAAQSRPAIPRTVLSLMQPFDARHTTSTTARVFPDRFSSPHWPEVAFQETMVRGLGGPRYVDRSDPHTCLVFTDGACLNNGQADPRAGWSVVCGPRAPSDPPGVGPARTISGRLEARGPFGGAAAQTSNRAELRAAIAALRYRFWPAEAFSKLVIATDSEYVVEGATGWARGWVRNGWQTRGGGGVKNRDLWEYLLDRVQDLDEVGMRIEFWRIPREWNRIADAAAKEAARGAACDNYLDHVGVCA